MKRTLKDGECNPSKGFHQNPSDPEDKLSWKTCKSGEYQVDRLTCSSCHYSCGECNGPLSSDCTKCAEKSNRTLNKGQQCSPNKGFFDNGKDQKAEKCHYSCAECVTANKCTVPKEGRELNSEGLGECLPGTYDDKEQCHPCDKTC